MIFINRFGIDRAFGTVKKYCIRLYECKKEIKSIIFCGIAVLAILFSFILSGATFGLHVDYAGKIIATIKSQADFDRAVTLVSNSIEGTDVKQLVGEPVYTTALVLKSDINTTDQIARAIIDNTDEIITANVLEVNGEAVAKVESDEIKDLLEWQRNRFNVEGAESNGEFVDSVTIKEGYFLKDELTSLENAREVISNLAVRTVVQKSCEVAIPYSTKTQNNASQLRGYSKVLTKGVNGTALEDQTITYINGEEHSRVVNSSEVIASPITEILEVGTAKSVASQSQINIAKQSGFLFPLPRGSWVVSAYYGDGRNHQAVDLAADKGTAVFAVKGGTVVSAGNDGNYGLSIVIDHGNGIKTRYAHENAIYVRVGDKVVAGETIGTVGRTGNASGNHLHFEVIANGKRVDPAPYIDLV